MKYTKVVWFGLATVSGTLLVGAALQACDPPSAPQDPEPEPTPEPQAPQRCTSPQANPFLVNNETEVVSHCAWHRGPDIGLQHAYDWAGNVQPGPVPLSAPTFSALPELRTMDEDFRFQVTEYPICLAGTGNNDCSHFQFSFDASQGHTCQDYPFVHQNFIVRRGVGAMLDHLGGGLQCPIAYNFGAAPQATSGTVGTVCVPGSAVFDLRPRAYAASAANGTHSMMLTPIARTDVRPPERAWLRQIRVVSWGGVSSLHVAGNATSLSFANGVVTGGYTVSSPTTVQNIPVGGTSISANLGIDGVDPQNFPALPVVELTWSCEPNPAFTPVADHTPFLLDVSALGIAHRMVLWAKPSANQVRIAPYGRLTDQSSSAVQPNGDFSVPFEPYRARLNGRLSFSSGNVVISNGVLSVAGMPDVPLPQMTLPPL